MVLRTPNLLYSLRNRRPPPRQSPPQSSISGDHYRHGRSRHCLVRNQIPINCFVERICSVHTTLCHVVQGKNRVPVHLNRTGSGGQLMDVLMKYRDRCLLVQLLYTLSKQLFVAQVVPAAGGSRFVPFEATYSSSQCWLCTLATKYERVFESQETNTVFCMNNSPSNA